MRLVLHRVRPRRGRCALWVLVEKPGGKRPLGRSGRRGEGNTKTDFKEMGWGNVNWIDVAWDKDKWRAVGKAL
jgi:hypothetical protein